MQQKQSDESVKPQPIKIGFDLDGVILYNPARAVRPIVEGLKTLFNKKKKGKFYVPKSPLMKLTFRVFHLSSLFIAPGFERIRELTEKGIIEPYIVTARYSFLKNDFEHFLKRTNALEYFKGAYYNEKDEQPHQFKARMIKDLKLDVFVEDNWNIVEHLNKNTQARVIWVYNIFDSAIPYLHKVPALSQALGYILKKKSWG